MKLSELRSAIRKMKGNPSVVVELTPGKPMTLVLQKTPTLETLGSMYASESGDIGLTLDDDTGIISGPNSVDPNLVPVFGGCPDLEDAMTPAPNSEDDEDML